MTTTSDRIAAAIKGILDDDRRADRERIAALERGVGFLNLRVSNEEERANNALATIDSLNKQLDELTEKCAVLVFENKRLVDSLAMGNPYGPGHTISGGLDDVANSGPLPWESRK